MAKLVECARQAIPKPKALGGGLNWQFLMPGGLEPFRGIIGRKRFEKKRAPFLDQGPRERSDGLVSSLGEKTAEASSSQLWEVEHQARCPVDDVWEEAEAGKKGENRANCTKKGGIIGVFYERAGTTFVCCGA